MTWTGQSNFASMGYVRERAGILTAPVTLIVPGVLAGSNGPLYYPADEIARAAPKWNGVPVTLEHPTKNGQYVAVAGTPEQTIGKLRNARFEDGKLKADAAFDITVLEALHPQLLADLRSGLKVEVSTGLFTRNEPATGEYNRRPYEFIARDHRPDHLAILPDAVGACSVRDGCGTNNVLTYNQVRSTFLKDKAMCNDNPFRQPYQHVPTTNYGTVPDHERDQFLPLPTMNFLKEEQASVKTDRDDYLPPTAEMVFTKD